MSNAMTDTFSADIPDEAPIVIVGAGPVGMSLAMELGRRGIPVLVLEQRALFTPPEPKCNHVSARTMEIFRKFGVAAAVRAAGLPPDHPHDVVYSTSFAGYELARLRIPPSVSRYRDEGYGDGAWPTPEPPHRINQTYLEPILLEHAMSFPAIAFRGECLVESLTRNADHVVVAGRSLAVGRPFEVRAGYVIGCDGTRSMVRKAMNARFEGDDGLMASTMCTITAPGLAEKAAYNRAWMHWILNPEQVGNIIALDGRDRYIVNLFRPVSMPESEVDLEGGLRALLGVDVAFSIENRTGYVGRRMLATQFALGRVFIAGDAAHNWLPMAGYAMNAGIADAVNLGWKLAAVIEGWADPKMLDAYEAERRPILDQVSRKIAQVRKNQEFILPPELTEPGAKGWLARERVGRFMFETDSPQFACKGINFGYYYEQSPVIAYDGAAAPSYSLSTYTPSTVPGCRLPHVWLRPDLSLYDELGDGLTMLRLDPALSLDPLLESASASGVPLTVIDVGHEPGREHYDHSLLLARGDQHIVWRGNSLPTDAQRLLDHVRSVALAEEFLPIRSRDDAAA